MSVQQPGPVSPGSSGYISQGQIRTSEWKGHSVTVSDLALPPGLSPLSRTPLRPELEVASEERARAPGVAAARKARSGKPGLVHRNELLLAALSSQKATKPLPPDPPY